MILIKSKSNRLIFFYLFGAVFFSTLLFLAINENLGNIDNTRFFYFVLIINIYYIFFISIKHTSEEVNIKLINTNNILSFYVSSISILFKNLNSAVFLCLCLIWTIGFSFILDLRVQFIITFSLFELILLLNLTVTLITFSLLKGQYATNRIVWALLCVSLIMMNIDFMFEGTNLTLFNPLTTLIMADILGNSVLGLGVFNIAIFFILILINYLYLKVMKNSF